MTLWIRRLVASTGPEWPQPSTHTENVEKLQDLHMNDDEDEDEDEDQDMSSETNSSESDSEDSEDDSDESSDSEASSDSDGASSTNSEDDFQLGYKPARASSILETQLSPDGTCVFTSDRDRTFTVYILGRDIPNPESPMTLSPHARLAASTPIRAFAAPPWFTYEGWQHAPVLVSSATNYISCHRALYNPHHIRTESNTDPIDISEKTATYRLIDHLTEAVIAPHSLAFASDGKRFLAGSKNQISLFDRDIEYGPIEVKRTIPSARNILKGGGVGYKGTISALAMGYRSNLFAAGSWSSHVGLYRLMPGGGIEGITDFPLPRKYSTNPHHNRFDGALRGDGVTQMRFSPCENYLYIAERHSDSILVYDIRNVALSLSYCTGRNARTVQKLGFDIFPIPTGPGHLDLWAGGVDGVVRIWNNPHLCEGAVRPCVELAMHQDPVSGVIVHGLGQHLITATGRVEVRDTDEDSAKRRVGIYPRKTISGSLNVFQLASSPDVQMG